jgi:hypothetical protein
VFGGSSRLSVVAGSFCLRETVTFLRFFEESVPVTVAIRSLRVCSDCVLAMMPLRRNRDSGGLIFQLRE